MRYFIHGDDFGRSHSRNLAIDRLMGEGSLDGTSLIVNLESTNEAVLLARQGGYEEKVCFHLNLSEGTPLTEAIRKTGLCRQSGDFRWAGSKRILATCLSARTVRAIREEAEKQMQCFRALGFSSKRMDSHDWVLFNLPVWLAVKPLLKQYGFEITRTACENWIRTKNRPLRTYYKGMAKRIGGALQLASSWSGGIRSLERAYDRGLIRADTVAEIMTHPIMLANGLFDASNHEEISFAELTQTLANRAQRGDVVK